MITVAILAKGRASLCYIAQQLMASSSHSNDALHDTSEFSVVEWRLSVNWAVKILEDYTNQMNPAILRLISKVEFDKRVAKYVKLINDMEYMAHYVDYCLEQESRVTYLYYLNQLRTEPPTPHFPGTHRGEIIETTRALQIVTARVKKIELLLSDLEIPDPFGPQPEGIETPRPPRSELVLRDELRT